MRMKSSLSRKKKPQFCQMSEGTKEAQRRSTACGARRGAMKAPAVVLDRGSLKLDIPVPVFVDDAVQVGLLYVQHVTLVHVIVALTLALVLRKVLTRCLKVHAHVRAMFYVHPLRWQCAFLVASSVFYALRRTTPSCPVAAPSPASSRWLIPLQTCRLCAALPTMICEPSSIVGWRLKLAWICPSM